MFGVFKKKTAASAQPTTLGGTTFAFQVVGESNYQPAIRKLADQYFGYFDATLVREPRNPHDKNAVRIQAEFGPVGYLSRENAAKWARYLDRTGTVVCRGRTISGRGNDRGVTLNLPDLPPG